MMAAPRQSVGWSLSTLVGGLAALAPTNECTVTGLSLDSRTVQPGDLYLACRGRNRHGLAFVGDAVAAGAVAVLFDPQDAPAVGGAPVPLVPVPHLGERAGILADRFFGEPSRALTVIGITGTNGKTSCSHYLAQALHDASSPCGVIGTLGSGLYPALTDSGHTTPSAVDVHAALADFQARGARAAVMEVSSHALDQGRVNGVHFKHAIFTNLTREHLDYHGDMQAYEEAKRRLFRWPDLGHAVINVDDPAGRRLLQTLPATIEAVAYGLNPEAVAQLRFTERGQRVRRVGAGNLVMDADGLTMSTTGDWGDSVIRAGLLGRFNASNLLSALPVLLLEGWSLAAAAARLARTHPVAGRMERFGGAGGPLLVVDYAHTPDALEQALGALREHCRGRLVCVFGCGGERDPGKRPEMGAIAERLADRVVITDDNPRGEDGDRIVADILAGLVHPERAFVQRERERAVREACAAVGVGDVVLIAGKGHETYQLVGTRRIPFSDRALARRLAAEVRA